ncbi:MAG: DUF4126 domain-containing protein [Candidatus Odyssella sp.]|nr:DUF4126 domain-containing protein [Candidatus Odyssella sp.]
MDPVSAIAMILGVGWASGINLYAAILTLGLLGATGAMALPPDLQILASPIVIAAAAAMYAINFFADKIPGVDSVSDVLHTFIRIPAGALLAAAAAGQMGPEWQLAAGILGGTLAAGSHAAKTGTRVLINTSPEPFTNWAASIGEDVAVIGGMWLAVKHPYVFLGLLAVVVALTIWLLPKIFRLIGKLFRKLANWVRGRSNQPAPAPVLVTPLPAAPAAPPPPAAPPGPEARAPGG